MTSPREQLSPKEIIVATMVWEGLTNPQIAVILGSTEQVVKNQLRGVFDKLGVWSQLELAIYIASRGGADWARTLQAGEVAPPAMATGFAARSA